MTTLSDEQICLGHDETLAEHRGAMMPPIVQTSLFAQTSFEALVTGLHGEKENYLYTRGNNPTVAALESKLAALERGEECKCFASGMAAISAVLLGLLKSGDHLLFVNRIYGPTIQLAQHLTAFGIRYDIVPDLDLATVEASIRKETRLIYMESPGTMTFRLVDIAGLVEIARTRGILTVHDNTWATPLFQKPLTLGVDIVVHSCSKYIGGHSDVVAGAVVSRQELVQKIFYKALMLNGGIIAPFDAWLLIRGLRTLPVRMRQHQQDGLSVAHFLARHPAVAKVFHPALEGDDRMLAAKQLSGYAGLFSFQLATRSFAEVSRVINRLKWFRIGVSWGGVESLVLSPHRGDDPDPQETGIPAGLVRLSIGHEGADALIEDLDQALATV